jgi:predicted ATPase
MIQKITFRNYKALRNTELPLGRFTLLIGPNGSGKSTVFHALQSVRAVWMNEIRGYQSVVNLDARGDEVRVDISWWLLSGNWDASTAWNEQSSPAISVQPRDRTAVDAIRMELARLRVYSLIETTIAQSSAIQPQVELATTGGNLAAVLDRLRDRSPESFEALNDEMGSLLPEFDRILFDTVAPGQRIFQLRTRNGQFPVPASDLSQGTLLALTILTLCHLPDPPSIVCLEEPDRGIHPRLYRDVQQALYRLAYPENYGLDRKPVQVIATTHSPFVLDLHRDNPEEIVIAEKRDHEAFFHRLVDYPDIEEILGDVSLGEAWYSGILGGVPASR